MKDLNAAQPKSKKWMWVGVAALLLIGAAGYWWYQRSQTTQQPATTVDGGVTDKTKLPDNPGPASSDKVPQKEGVSTQITRLEQNGNDVVIEGAVTGATEGSCVAEFTTPKDLPVNGEAKLTKNGDGAKCGPITLAAADFQYLGEWQVVLTVYTGGGKAVSQAKTITIK